MPGILSRLLGEPEINAKQQYAAKFNQFIKLVSLGVNPDKAMRMAGLYEPLVNKGGASPLLDKMNQKMMLEGNYDPKSNASVLLDQNRFIYPGGGMYEENAKSLRQPVIKNPPPKSGIID